MSDHQYSPTRCTLLRRIVAEYESLEMFWCEGYFERGLGAVVLYQVHTAVGNLRSVSEFWTLGDVRAYVRSLGYFDEFIHAWFTSVCEADAFPVLVIGAEGDSGQMRLSFYRIHKPVVERFRKNS
jgi:hypothetical protein